MNRRRIATLALLASFAAVGAARAATEHVALFKNVSGAVQVVRGSVTTPATPGLPLLISDRLISGPGAAAGIVFRDGTAITLGPASELQVRDYVFQPQHSQYGFSVYLSKGSAIYASGKIGKLAPEKVQVGTPTATVGVRGTRFLIQAE